MLVKTRLVALLAVIALLVSALTSAAAAGRPRTPSRADLTVTAPSYVARVQQGRALTVSTVVKNAGRVSARATTTRFALSTDRRVGRDRSLSPGRATVALRPGRSVRLAGRVTVPTAVAPGTYWLVACADAGRRVTERSEANNCRVGTRSITVFSVRSSHDLIGADVAAGRISADRGLVYRVFADFKDDRLPDRYVGRPNGVDEGALGEAAERWYELSASYRELLRPFLIPPFYAGSHWTPAKKALPPLPRADGASQRRVDAPWCSFIGTDFPPSQDWEYLDTAGGDVRIWWLDAHPDDAATAAHYVDILDDKILPALGSLMGTGPKPDGAGTCSGGSDALDIALVEGATTASTFGESLSCADGSSASIVMPRTHTQASWRGADPYLAHEVMHAIQFAKPTVASCAGGSWVREMTAEWVQDYVTDPTYGVGLGPDDTEHQIAQTFLDNPAVPLDVVDPPTNHDYSAYLLPQWVVRNGKTSFVKDVWDEMARHSPTQAVDKAVPGGGFAGSWDEFVLSAWNQGPVPHFRDWDGLQAGAAVTAEVKVKQPTTPVQQYVPVPHLAAQYLDVKLDPRIRELEVTHDKPGDAKVKLRAVITYDDGTSSVVDLSDKATHLLCIDDGTRRATSVVLVYSNADLSAQTKVTTTLVGSTTCGCQVATPGPRTGPAARAGACTLAGNLTYTYRDDYDGDDASGHQEWLGREEETGSISLVLVEDPRSPGDYDNAPGSTIDVTGTLDETWFRHRSDGCGDVRLTRTLTASGPLQPESASAYVDPRTGDLLLSAGITHPGLAEAHTEVTCSQTIDETYDKLVVIPRCAPDGNSPYYRLEPVRAGSKTYRMDCSEQWTSEGPDGQHHRKQSTVQATITLP